MIFTHRRFSSSHHLLCLQTQLASEAIDTMQTGHTANLPLDALGRIFDTHALGVFRDFLEALPVPSIEPHVRASNDRGNGVVRTTKTLRIQYALRHFPSRPKQSNLLNLPIAETRDKCRKV